MFIRLGLYAYDTCFDVVAKRHAKTLKEAQQKFCGTQLHTVLLWEPSCTAIEDPCLRYMMSRVRSPYGDFRISDCFSDCLEPTVEELEFLN